MNRNFRSLPSLALLLALCSCRTSNAPASLEDPAVSPPAPSAAASAPPSEDANVAHPTEQRVPSDERALAEQDAREATSDSSTAQEEKTPEPTASKKTSSEPTKRTTKSTRRAGVGEPCVPGDGPFDSPGNCQEGLLCCLNFHGQCGGAAPRPGEEREPCNTSRVCAAVPRCWGPPPSLPPGS